MKKAAFLLLASFASVSCASKSMLPASVDNLQFGGTEGKVGWSSYREEARLSKTTTTTAIAAAKAGLADAGFALRSVEPQAGRVTGERGITLHDWNVLAGVYVKSVGPDVMVAVLVEGSKDTGFSGDVTGDAWTGKILKGMRAYLKDQR